MITKAWITGITVASVAGTGGAAFAAMQANTQHDSAAAAAPQLTATSSTLGTQTYEFQAGPAGLVHLTATQDVITIDSALPSAGWTLLDYTTPAGHVEARFSDGTQIITFVADSVNGQVTAGISSSPAPIAVPVTDPTITAAPAPSTDAPPAETAAPGTPAPQPATPPQELTPVTHAPAPATTSAPSSSHYANGGDDDDDENESYESEDGGEGEGDDD